jgi:hypothetical protein
MPSLPGQALQSFHLTCASAALAMRQLPRRRRPHPAVLSPSPPQSTRAIFSTGDARRRTGSCSDHDRPALPPPSRSVSRLCDYPPSDKASDYPPSDKASNRAGASARDAAHDSLLGLGRRSLTPSWPPATLGLPAVALAALSHNRGPVLVGGLIRSLTAKVMAEIRFLLGSPRSRGIDHPAGDKASWTVDRCDHCCDCNPKHRCRHRSHQCFRCARHSGNHRDRGCSGCGYQCGRSRGSRCHGAGTSFCGGRGHRRSYSRGHCGCCHCCCCGRDRCCGIARYCRHAALLASRGHLQGDRLFPVRSVSSRSCTGLPPGKAYPLSRWSKSKPYFRRARS